MKKTLCYGGGIFVFALLFACIFTGCGGEEEAPSPTGEIIIKNIPSQVNDAQTVKIYVSVSNSTDPNADPLAQGTIYKSTGFSDTDVITVKLYKYTSEMATNPNSKSGGPWSGTAMGYSVTIRNATGPQNAQGITDDNARAGMSLNGSNRIFDWNNCMRLQNDTQKNAIYTRIIQQDSNLTEDTSTEP